MKTVIKFIALCSALSTSPAGKAQRNTLFSKAGKDEPLVDCFAVIPKDSPLSRCGWGFGANIFGHAFDLGSIRNPRRLQMRYGGNFYWTELNENTIGHVPLIAPQTGNATVYLYNTVVGINTVARFAQPLSRKINPYVDLFAGLRTSSADMDIEPEQRQPGYKSNSTQRLSEINQFNYGASFGIMASVSKYIKLNAAVTVSYAFNDRIITNTRNARLESGTVIADDMALPKKFVMATAGFVFIIDQTPCSCGYSSSHYRGRFGGRCSGGSSSHVKFSSHSLR